jgi:hypothetical protein
MRQEMDSMLPAKSGMLGEIIRDHEGGKCHLASGEPLSSSPSRGLKETFPLKETLEAVESVDNSEGEGDNDEDTESVASDCEVESECGECDGESPAVDGFEESPTNDEKNIKRCPSGASIVTYDEAPSKHPLLPEDGECERTKDRKTIRRADKSVSDDFHDDEQETSINAVSFLVVVALF